MKNNFVITLLIMSVLSLLVFAVGIYLRQTGMEDLGMKISKYGILFLALTLLLHFKKLYV